MFCCPGWTRTSITTCQKRVSCVRRPGNGGGSATRTRTTPSPTSSPLSRRRTAPHGCLHSLSEVDSNHHLLAQNQASCQLDDQTVLRPRQDSNPDLPGRNRGRYPVTLTGPLRREEVPSPLPLRARRAFQADPFTIRDHSPYLHGGDRWVSIPRHLLHRQALSQLSYGHHVNAEAAGLEPARRANAITAFEAAYRSFGSLRRTPTRQGTATNGRGPGFARASRDTSDLQSGQSAPVQLVGTRLRLVPMTSDEHRCI